MLEDNPELRQEIVDTALARILVIGAELSGDVRPLTGSGIALAVGLPGVLWAGLGVTYALGRAFAEIWDTPRLGRPGVGLAAVGALALQAEVKARDVRRCRRYAQTRVQGPELAPVPF